MKQIVIDRSCRWWQNQFMIQRISELALRWVICLCMLILPAREISR
jgi:hypothetical protein